MRARALHAGPLPSHGQTGSWPERRGLLSYRSQDGNVLLFDGRRPAGWIIRKAAFPSPETPKPPRHCSRAIPMDYID